MSYVENDQTHQGDVILSDSDRECTDSESTVLFFKEVHQMKVL